MSELILWFTKSLTGSCELERTMFIGNPHAPEVACVRGKATVAARNVGTFQWTPGVKAASAVFVSALARHIARIDTFLPLVEGSKGGAAASLDYALSKQPEWLFYMFGPDDKGDAYLRRLLIRKNPHFRRPGTVGFSLREELLSPNEITVYVDAIEVKDANQLRQIARALLDSDCSSERSPFETIGDSSEEQNNWCDSEEAYMGAQPAVVADPDNIYLFEQLQYFGQKAAKDRLLESCRYTVNPGDELPEAIMGRMVQAKHLFEEMDYATCDDATRIQFEKWIADMTPERDGEYGRDRTRDGQAVPGFLTWIQQHNCNEKFANSSLYKTFIWKDRVSGEIVATGTVAPDDRGITDRYDLGGQGHLGGLNIRFDLRNRGIGRYVRARIDHHIADFTRRRGRSQLIHAFSHMRGPRPLGSGFHRNKIAMVDTDFGSLPLWSKAYSP